MTWRLADAVSLCIDIEAFAPMFGCHVALTGGVLYRPCPRKDLDILFYRIRQVEEIDVDGMFEALAKTIGIERVTKDVRWCIKASYASKPIDCFFPDFAGSYPPKAGVDAPFTGTEL